MNVTTAYVRDKMRVFDKWYRRVSNKALLRDTGYWVPERGLKSLVYKSRLQMADVLGVDVELLPVVHEPNGRFDCDNFAALGCAIMKALFNVECREDGTRALEYAAWLVARNDIDHTQVLCLMSHGWHLIEFSTGEIVPVTKLDVLLIG